EPDFRRRFTEERGVGAISTDQAYRQYMIRATLAEGQGRLAEAIEALNIATALEEKRPEAWHHLARLLALDPTRADEAAEANARAEALRRANPPPGSGAGDASDLPHLPPPALGPTMADEHAEALWLERAGRYLDACAVWERIIAVHPEDAEAWVNLGRLLADHLGRDEDAEAVLRRAVAIDDQNETAWAYLGRVIHDQEGDLDEAEEALAQALQLDWNYATAWAWKARVLHTAGERLAEAEDGYRRAIDLSRSYPWCWAQLGLLYQEELGRFRDAEAAYRKAIEENPEYAWAWGQLGQLLG